ncbi:MAG: hypothetical protein OXF75_01085 [Acidimicrobiaceae bacterium]|nr:hypothetical protein [Acidimicrobiaceae bacterium]
MLRGYSGGEIIVGTTTSERSPAVSILEGAGARSCLGTQSLILDEGFGAPALVSVCLRRGRLGLDAVEVWA